MKRTKILFIWHAAVVETYQRYIAELAEHSDLEITLLMPKGHEEGSRYVEAFIPKNAKYKTIIGWQYYPKDPMISIYPALPWYLHQVKPDLIHLFEEPYHNIAAYLNFWTPLICPKAKLIFETLQNQVEDYRKPWIKIQKRTFERSSSAIAVTTEAKSILEHWGYRKPIHTIYLGTETKLYSPQNSANLRAQLGLNEFTIGYIGRMTNEKGMEDLIGACNQLNFPHQMLFMGTGKDRDAFRKLTDRAVWIDSIPPNEMNEYYSALDVLVLPSRTTPNWKEQFGRVLVEAMLCGVPVIGSSSGEIPNVIGEAGLVFKEGDPADLKEKLTLLHNDQNLRKALIERGLSRGKSFDWKIIADQVYKVYRESMDATN